MKSLSACIIVVAGGALLLGGSYYIQHSDTKLFIQFVGCVVCAIGLWGWLQTIKEK